MAKQKYGLGRGLDALIPGASEDIAVHQPSHIDKHAIVYAAINSLIPNPRQPRRIFREDDPKLLELSASIKEHGLLQPLVVSRLDKPAATSGVSKQAKVDDLWSIPNGNANEVPDSSASITPRQWETAHVVQFQIIAGERRWRASRLAGLTEIPVVIKEVTPQQMLELALIENIQRADLNPIEEALAYQALIQEFGLTQEKVAKQVGKDRSTITNSIRLLQLAPKVREALINQIEHFSEGHARTLIGIPREEDQITAMGKIIESQLNVRQAEELATRIKAVNRTDTANLFVSTKMKRSAELNVLETHFRDALMVKVDLKCNTKGKGRLILHFNDQDELDRLYSQLVQRDE